MSSSISNEINQDIINLKKKLIECQTIINEKDYYLAKLEMDLEHAIGQCKKIAAAKNNSITQWINRSEPGLETK